MSRSRQLGASSSNAEAVDDWAAVVMIAVDSESSTMYPASSGPRYRLTAVR